MEVEIREMPELRLATVPHVGRYDRIGEAFERLEPLAAAAGLEDPGTPLVAVYHDDPETTPEPELRSDAGILLAPRAQLPRGLHERLLPAGRYACATHVGPYERLGEVWVRLLAEWLPLRGHRAGRGPTYELYRNTPREVPRERLVTELYVPLA